MSNEQKKSEIDPQITDSVTQANVKVIGEAPSMAMGDLLQAQAQATNLAMQNAISAQQSALDAQMQSPLNIAVQIPGVMDSTAPDSKNAGTPQAKMPAKTEVEMDKVLKELEQAVKKMQEAAKKTK